MRPNPYVYGLLIASTFAATTMVGMRYMFDFRNGRPPITSATDLFPFRWAAGHLNQVSDGLPFSLTLLAILLSQQLGRLCARRYSSAAASLAVDLPAPSQRSTLGTFSRIPSRVASRAARAVMGAAGPLAGFVAAFATTCYGLQRSTRIGEHVSPSLLRISAPALMSVLRTAMLASYPDIPPIPRLLPHPALFASWIGLFITTCHLIPAGRLAGGRILYSFSPRLHRITSAIVMGTLLYLGIFEWIGWLLLALVLILLPKRHLKLIDHSPPGFEWLVFVPICVAIFLLCFTTQPIVGMSLTQVLLNH